MKNNELRKSVDNTLEVLYKMFGKAKVISCLSDYIETIGIEDELTITTDYNGELINDDKEVENLKAENEMIKGYADDLLEENLAYKEMLADLEEVETKEDESSKINNGLGLIPVSQLDTRICDYYKNWSHIGSGNEQTFREFVKEGIEQFDLYINTPLDEMSDEQFTTLLEQIDYMYAN